MARLSRRISLQTKQRAIRATPAPIGALAPTVLALYPAAGEMENPSRRYAAIVGDVAFHCNALKQARQFSRYVPTYAYEFADRAAPNILAPFEPSFDQGAAHAVEIQYVLNTEAVLRERGMTDEQIGLAESVAEYWTAVARTGDPSQGEAGVAWPAFINGSQETLRWLNTHEPATIESSAFIADHRCAVWGADPDS
jgi:para-nitrobenzyl esterase